MFIKGIRREKHHYSNKYPFNIPALSKFSELEFNTPVTFFIGENGSGKSTLIEAIATAYGFNPEGGSSNMSFSTFDSHSVLSDYIVIMRNPIRPKDGFFLRAESFYNVASFIEQLDGEDFSGKPLKQVYGGSLHECSHGESFLALLTNRLFGNGLYIFDEPEASLSPQRQLSMLNVIKDLVDNQSQFIIATHSPILLSYPNSTIYQFKNDAIQKIKYEESEPYLTTKDFLNNYKRWHELLFTNE